MNLVTKHKVPKNVFINYTPIEGDEFLSCSDVYVVLTENINTFLVPMIVICGLFGNLMAAQIFFTTKLKQRSSSVYLGTLSLADFGYLIGVLIIWLDYHNIIDFNFLCPINIFISSAFSNLSVWLIVAFTIERFIAVKYPLKRPQVCTTSRARITTLIIALLSFLSQTYILYVAELIPFPDARDVCEMREEYHEFVRVVNYLDTLFALVLPLGIIVVLNGMIAKAIFAFRGSIFREQSIGRSISTNSSGVDLNQSNVDSRAEFIHHTSTLCVVKYERRLMAEKSQRSITKILLLISSVFVLLNVPSYLLRLYTFTMENMLERSVPSVFPCLIQNLTIVLFYLNHCVNFLLYSMYGAAFRKALFDFTATKVQKIKKIFNK